MKQSKTILLSIVFLIIGLGGGYYYGLSAGKEQGRVNLLAEQEAEAVAALEEIQNAVNPFGEEGQIVNPFAEESNPLEGVFTNPFAQ